MDPCSWKLYGFHDEDVLNQKPIFLEQRLNEEPRVWQTIISCPVIFEEKLDIWKSDSMSNLAIFWEILKIRRRKFLKKSHEIRHFIYLFSPNLGGKSCKSLVRKRSPLDNALWRRNCCLNPQKQPLFWEKSNENLTTRHLQRARKLNKMSSNWTQINGLSHPGHHRLLMQGPTFQCNVDYRNPQGSYGMDEQWLAENSQAQLIREVISGSGRSAQK